MKITRENILKAIRASKNHATSTHSIRKYMGLSNTRAVRRALLGMEACGIVKRYPAWSTANSIYWQIV